MRRRVGVLGLPESGKSTFLVALWHNLRNAESRYRARLIKGDFTYLSRLERKWLSYQDLGRTSRSAETDIELDIEDTHSGAILRLEIPDVAGEHISEIWTLGKAWDRGLGDYGHYLVFLNPSANNQLSPVGLSYDEQLRALGLSPDTATNGVAVWEPELAPAQMQLAYILDELMRTARADHGTLRFTVVMSAWDKIVGRYPTPFEAVRCTHPLLYGLMKSCGYESTFYAVSAQGGEYPGLKQARQGVFDHASRLTIVSSNGTDISLDELLNRLLQ